MTGYEIFKQGLGNRDPIFREVLSYFGRRPIDILEIGCMRSKDERASGGWSTFFMAEYVKEHGGSLTIVDTNLQSLENCAELLGDFYTESNGYQTTGAEYIKSNNETWDLAILDGSDNPNDMLEEFELLIGRAEYIYCDDFSTKGILLRDKYPEFKLYKWPGAGHECAVYGPGIKKETIYLTDLLK